ncbi:hypothetical protein QYE76_042328 [Lolium multiflorum]|uniref:Reverse transcriptase Ty1/copia-type domain-containing protein n=1 Tax=Lolium multiflorum TaxID=4521 RepID=A0AAD8WUU2_LOLMU|nr:hypothetical protein QYE76_042328 [Lolium multiflorum]
MVTRARDGIQKPNLATCILWKPLFLPSPPLCMPLFGIPIGAPPCKPSTTPSWLTPPGRSYLDHCGLMLSQASGFQDQDEGRWLFGAPAGFINPRHRDHVCRLTKALYGLRQAPRAWFCLFADFATTLGFTASRSDASLFILRRGSDSAYLVLYVDDIVLAASSTSLLQAIIDKLQREFAMKDMGALYFFLGISVCRTPRSFFLSQAQYAEEILARAGMVDCKTATTPIYTSPKVAADAGSPVSDPLEYRSLAGALQYLTMTRPDLAWSSKRQATVSRSSAEAEYRAVATAVADCVWLRQLLEDYMEYYEDVSAASTADMAAHVELNTNYGSPSIVDMTDIEELYTDNGSPSMDDMVEQHHEYDIDTMVEPHLASTMNNTGASKYPILANGATYEDT